MGERIDPTEAPDPAEREELEDASSEDVEAHRRVKNLDEAADDDGDDVEGHRRPPVIPVAEG
jgi:hypothetical protein